MWCIVPPMQKHTDFLVIGSGLAGLAFALKACRLGRVTVCSKEQISTTNTAMAQGGIAAVTSTDDSFDSHVQDTLVAGAGLCRPNVVKNVVEQGPDRIQDLLDWGVRFDSDLTREGGHSQRRIFHVADHTGLEIHRQLLNRAQQEENIEFIEDALAVDLIVHEGRARGAYIFNKKTESVFPLLARATVLATGGAGKVYLYTSNWHGATGDGIAMAHRAGAQVANLEFMQFHPTCLYHQGNRNFLISEALRGEGGELINSEGQAFMKKHHPLGSLAPRDIVARGIDEEMKRKGVECVYLDVTKHSRDYLQKRFPVIFQKCLELGIDISKQPIPVVPAAHYLCGGVVTDINGETNVPGLFALGETACTGLHGANRLASNSLLECLTFSHNAAIYLSDHPERKLPDFIVPEFPHHDRIDADELIVVHHMWEEIRRLMWNYMGIVRSDRRLERALHRLQNIQQEIRDYYTNFKLHADVIELRNIALVAELSVRCALMRKESIGIHYNLDRPVLQDFSNVKDSLI